MKTAFFKISGKTLVAGGFLALTGLTSCKTLPLYTRHFLENEGAPIALNDQPLSKNINGELPENIYIKTQTQTFSFDYDYMLIDGKIWAKLRSEPKSEWKLFQDTGLPFSAKKQFFPVERVTEIAADGDVLYAFSSEGKLYRCYTKHITHYTPFEWIDYFGWPRKIQLYQNSILMNKKAWAVGSSRKDVQYYTDISGSEHNYGPLGVESIPFLCEDGTTIQYCDPACPSDFSHSFRCPDNVVLENLSESASTFFVIAKDGSMFTRLVDYNTVGSDPMLYDYSYKDVYSGLKGNVSRSNTSVWALPNEPWKKEPALPKGVKGTTYITIIQNGKGNDARELRVAALNPNGETGYYTKQLNDEVWQFVKVPMELPQESFTKSVSVIPEKPVFQTYTGGLWKNGKQIPNVKCSVNNFHFSEGPFTLSFGDDFSVDFYYSEIWTLFLRLKPGLIEEPIRYFGTATFDSAKYTNFSNKEIKEIFSGKNKEIHEFYIEAFDSYLSITLKTKQDFYEFYLTENGNIISNPVVDRTFIQKDIQFQQRLENQKIFYDESAELNDILKVEKKINKKKKKTSANLNRFIYGKKKNHPFVRVVSEKVGIILQYSGEICTYNKQFYKENYKLTKRYSQYIKAYNKILEEDPSYDSLSVITDFIEGNPKFEGKNVILLSSMPYFPGFIVQEEDSYTIYTFEHKHKALYKTFLDSTHKLELNDKTFFYKKGVFKKD